MPTLSMNTRSILLKRMQYKIEECNSILDFVLLCGGWQGGWTTYPKRGARGMPILISNPLFQFGRAISCH